MLLRYLDRVAETVCVCVRERGGVGERERESCMYVLFCSLMSNQLLHKHTCLPTILSHLFLCFVGVGKGDMAGGGGEVRSGWET